MKRLFLYLLVFVTFPAMAQYRSHGGQGHDGHNQGHASSLTIVAPRHQAFWLFVDDVLQNEQPVHSIRINNLWPDEFYVRVELDNREQNCFGQFIDLRHPQGFSIEEHRGFFGLESTHGDIRPELVMNLNIGNIMPEPPMPPAPHEEVIIPTPMPPAQSEPMGMSPKDFDEAYTMIQHENFDDTRLAIAKQVVTSNKMTINQIKQIATLFSFESNKLEFAKFAYPYCIEKNKYYLLYDVFDHASSKQELNEYIQGL